AQPRRRAQPPRPARRRLGQRLREPLQRDLRPRPPAARQGRPSLRPRQHRDGARHRLPPAQRRRQVTRRLPVRVKLTLAFTVAIAAVLTATALFLYLRLRTELDNRIDESLHTRLELVSARLGEERG